MKKVTPVQCHNKALYLVNEGPWKFNSHTLRTVFLSCFSTRFCDSMPDVFCRNGRRTGDIGYCHVQLTPFIKRKALREPGQQCRQRWDTGVPQTQPKRLTIMAF